VETKDHYKEGKIGKKPKRVLVSDEFTPSPRRNQPYQEYNNNTSATDDDDDDDRGDGASRFYIAPSGGGT
jgi:hypothetical protein